ncbi:MAG: putative transcriptional regulator [Clostridia bacterium]|jgi:DNA-binding XRE family transcriptional regulator|nr:putative transcriptional regulator [Clostridia bacterium]
MIADKIKELRERVNLSQTALAKKLQVSRSTVNAWEMSISQPTIKYVIEMSNIFNVSTDNILEMDNSNNLSLKGLNDKQIEAIIKVVDCFKH